MLYDTTKKLAKSMESLGEILRRERERRGLTIDALAEQTRINAAYFRAIEEGDRESLPGGFFYRSFLRQYARLLELPESVYEAEIGRSLEQEAHDPVGLPDRHIDVPPLPTGSTDRGVETRRWVVRVAALVAVVALATMLYTVYLRWRTPAEVAQDGRPEPPPIAMPTEPEPEPPAATDTT
jgi:cytoskeleton protein RodZ